MSHTSSILIHASLTGCDSRGTRHDSLGTLEVPTIEALRKTEKDFHKGPMCEFIDAKIAPQANETEDVVQVALTFFIVGPNGFFSKTVQFENMYNSQEDYDKVLGFWKAHLSAAGFKVGGVGKTIAPGRSKAA